MNFDPAKTKVSIGSLDDPGLHVEAQYNPKELQIDKTVPWQKHNTSNVDDIQLEFTGAEPRTMSLELLFDGYETNSSVQGRVAKLETMASVRNASAPDPELRRPHHCVVVWGTVIGGLANKFLCVIESMSTKYTMFHSHGYPLRATVTLKLKEAERVSMASSGGSGASGGASGGTGASSGTGGTGA
jgi:hypothetical protein